MATIYSAPSATRDATTGGGGGDGGGGVNPSKPFPFTEQGFSLVAVGTNSVRATWNATSATDQNANNAGWAGIRFRLKPVGNGEVFSAQLPVNLSGGVNTVTATFTELTAGTTYSCDMQAYGDEATINASYL